MHRHLPNIVTLLNLLFGIFASLSLLYGQLEMALWWFGLSLSADFLDGFVARWLQVSSPLGKELDSLADLVSFGLAPGIIFYGLLIENQTDAWPNSWNWIGTPAFILTLSAALRLGRFNLDSRQNTDFIGLPTPACALFSFGLLTIRIFYPNNAPGYLLEIPFLVSSILLLSILMQANMPMFSLKLKGGWKDNKVKILFVVFCTIMLIWQPKLAPISWVISYIILSVMMHFFTSKKTI
jgi:CDP-diacylglycerol--serine O-phosphatidyltransferase